MFLEPVPLQEATRDGVTKARFEKRTICQAFEHSFATHPLRRATTSALSWNFQRTKMCEPL